MNFFKSVFSDDPDPPPGSESDNERDSGDPGDSPGRDTSPAEHRGDPSGGGAWDFGGLMKTLSAKSESIIEVYRRDLQEFHTGLKKEMEVAQGSLETVGHAIDQFGNNVMRGTAQIRDAILESDSDNNTNKNKQGSPKSLNSKRYNRFDAQVRAIQGDPNTYTEVPGDLDRYNKWKSEFSLEGKGEEMEGLLKENDAMESVYKRVVPNIVDHETFWYRYYYRVYKLKKAEDVRARLVRRMSREEEELSWDVEDEDEEEEEEEYVVGGKNSEMQGGGFDGNGVVGTKRLSVENVRDSGGDESKVEKRDRLLESKELDNKMGESSEDSKVDKNLEVVQEKGDGSKENINQVDPKSKDSAADSDEKIIIEKKELGDGKSLPVASQHSEYEEEDLEWDEIEDLSSIDEKKATQSGGSNGPSKVDLRKRLSAAAEDEEDLSWDIEDGDEPTKA